MPLYDLPIDVLVLVLCHVRLPEVARLSCVCRCLFVMLTESPIVWCRLVRAYWLFDGDFLALSPTISLAAREYFAFDLHQRRMRRLQDRAFLNTSMCIPRYVTKVITTLAHAKLLQNATKPSLVPHIITAPENTFPARDLLQRLWMALLFRMPHLGMSLSCSGRNQKLLDQCRLRLVTWEHASQCASPYIVYLFKG